jgi:putative endonuclease
LKPRYRQMLRKMEVREREAAPAAPAGAAVWSLYILKCCDRTFYTGVTNDLDRRFRAHQEGKASRFTRTRRPVEMVYTEECGSRSQALSRECAVKTLSRRAKEDLVAGASSGSRSNRRDGPRVRVKGPPRSAASG